ncbi:MAG: hypothetical protein ACYTG7_09690 [Planctomycetota bacterium]|jgi:hypothetical protein
MFYHRNLSVLLLVGLLVLLAAGCATAPAPAYSGGSLSTSFDKFVAHMTYQPTVSNSLFSFEATDDTDTPSTTETQVDAEAAPEGQQKEDLKAVGSKLANPIADLWALVMNFETPKFYDGDLNLGDPKVGYDMIFQPIMPIPLHGEGEEAWRLITRPVIPFIFRQPIPEGFDKFDRKTGIGDMQLPLLLGIPAKYAGKWILGGGPVGIFPTGTHDDLSQDQFGLGPAIVVGYKTENLTAVLFPNYFWKVGSTGQDDNKPDMSQGTLLYSFQYQLPNAWQIGTNPTITFNDKAAGGDKWNVPVGVFIGKTIKAGKMPINIKAGVEYSVVSPDSFGKRAILRFQITPVIPSLISGSRNRSSVNKHLSIPAHDAETVLTGFQKNGFLRNRGKPR